MPGDDRRRPGERAASDFIATDPSMLRVAVTVTVNLKHGGDPDPDLDRADRRALADLDRVPDGAHLVVQVGSRYLLTNAAVGMLNIAARRLDVELVSSDPSTARRWHRAILTGEIQ